MVIPQPPAPPKPSDLVRLAQAYRTALDRDDAALMREITQTYLTIYRRIETSITALVNKIGTMDDATPGDLKKLREYAVAIETIKDELGRFGTYMDLTVSKAAQQGIERGLAESTELARVAAGNRAITAGWRTLNPSAVETMMGFLDRDGPLYQRISELAPFYADKISRTMVEGISLGWNPRKLADAIDNGLGLALTDALRTARTAQIWSYREASRANYIANNDVVKGWIWYAELDGETCAACVAMHGTVHDLDEVLDDHYNGRCTMLPLTIGAKNDIQGGADWLKEQGEATQRAILGKGKFEAWQDGRISIDQLSKRHDDPVYGSMTTETPLKELITERETENV